MISYLKIVLILFHSFVISLLTILLIPFNYKGKIVHFLSKAFATGILFIAGVKCETEGLNNIDKNSAYIFVSNHLSYFDIPVLMKVIPNNLRFIYKKSLSVIPVWGWATYLGGYIPINRKNAREALNSLASASRKIKEGISVAIFPEGTRSVNGNIGEFKKGVFVVARESGKLIVPVTIIGTNKILPKKSLKIRSGKVKVIINKPVKYGEGEKSISDIREIIISRLKE